MEVMGSRGDGEQVPGGAGAELAQCRFCTLTWPEQVTGRISEAGKGPPFSGRRCEVALPRARLQDKGTRVTAAMFANSLSHSRCSTGPWKLPCEGELLTSFLR